LHNPKINNRKSVRAPGGGGRGERERIKKSKKGNASIDKAEKEGGIRGERKKKERETKEKARSTGKRRRLTAYKTTQ